MIVTTRLVVGLIVAGAVTAACGGRSGDTLVVLAAASLADAFDEIETAYEDANPGVDVQLNLAGSSALREQILDGAPADVFASANEATMAAVMEAGAVDGDPVPFARNGLVVAVPAGNPGGVTDAADLADEDLLVGLCAEGVPCGDLARRALADAGVVPSLDTNEPDVRALLTKIVAGELDAGIVYVSDAVSAGADVETVDIPGDVETSYPIAALADAGDPQQARGFVAFVLSAVGQEILARHGFGAP